MMHSLLCSSMDWLYLGPEKSLGFLLAEAGYDVWMGNVRGNTWSRKHVKLDPDRDNDFWEFTFHEHGYYDVGAYIDHILNVTKHKQLYYIGHSQGTTELFILTSMRPEYNEKIIHGISLAPIAFMTDVRSPIIGMMVKFKRQLNNLFELFNVRELLSSSKLIKEAGKVLCADGSPFQEYCSLVIFSLAGFDSPQLNKTHIPVIVYSTPAGTSAKNLLHFYALIDSGKFIQFDYGRAKNLKNYNSVEPPEYNLSRISIPITLYTSQNDYLSSMKDVVTLSQSLKNSVIRKIKYKRFTHLDYLMAKDVDRLLNNELIDYMNSIRNGSASHDHNKGWHDTAPAVLLSFVSLTFVCISLIINCV
ncbi:unnamed protein product [Callosobruchus maculatus]|nr:unnamed protein product [Callosobruchus maculatus]